MPACTLAPATVSVRSAHSYARSVCTSRECAIAGSGAAAARFRFDGRFDDRFAFAAAFFFVAAAFGIGGGGGGGGSSSAGALAVATLTRIDGLFVVAAPLTSRSQSLFFWN